jgi:hypothetical protein
MTHTMKKDKTAGEMIGIFAKQLENKKSEHKTKHKKMHKKK